MNIKNHLFLIGLLFLTAPGFTDADGGSSHFLIVPSTNPDPALKAAEDTSALQAAFDAAAGLPGRVVEIGAGVLLLDQTIHILDFDGIIKGQGMDQTEVKDRGFVDASFEFPVNTNRPRDGLFVIYQTDDRRRHVRVQDLSSGMGGNVVVPSQGRHLWQVLGEHPWAIDNAPTPLSTSWTRVGFTDFSGIGLVRIALFLEGVPNLSATEGVSGFGPFFGYVSDESGTPVLLAGLSPLGGQHVIEDCTFIDLPFVGIETGHLADATVLVRNSLFENTRFPMDPKNSSNTRIEYVENTVRGAANGFELVQGQYSDFPGLGVPGVPSPEPARVVVARNDIELLENVVSDFAAGVYLQDFTNRFDQSSTYFGKGAVDVTVEDNQIFIPDPGSNAIGVLASWLVQPTIIDNHVMTDGNTFLRGTLLQGSTEALVAGNEFYGFTFGVHVLQDIVLLENGGVKWIYSEDHRISDNYIQESALGVVLEANTRDNRLQGNEIVGAIVFDYVLAGPYGPLVLGPASGNRIVFDDGDATVFDFSGCTNVDGCPQLDQDSDGSFDEDPIDGIDNDDDGLIDEDPADLPNTVPE